MRRDSDVSEFDTPQDESHGMDYRKPTEQRQKLSVSKNTDIDNQKDVKDADDDDDDYNFNDQLIVLVEHQGSDDELVIDVDKGDDSDGDDESEVNIDEQDQDLLDVTTFARNGSITTAGVVSEGTMAFNSVSVNPSVSSLLSSDESGEEKDTNKHARAVCI